MTPSEDNLTLATLLLNGAMGFCILGLLLMAVSAFVHPDPTAGLPGQLVRQHGLQATTLLPLNRPERFPEGILPAVDLRHEPRLPIGRPDAGLVFPTAARVRPHKPSQP